ncbi:hypothetical protein Cadr_000011759 [Camelus dromedarius]|uniref:Uncharacterized protein n=1 Tax=Camelus dromedarius TaxID=9838 RepID=A0A5N4DTT8_CAMDR|nr:hypothetical protein Cadr_000011759 [Camelus dromedarius]
MLTVSFLIQGAKILCLGITASGIYLGQVTSMISHSTNPQTPTTVSKPTYPVRAGQGHSDNSPSKKQECPKENTTTHAVGIVYNLESSTGADPP